LSQNLGKYNQSYNIPSVGGIAVSTMLITAAHLNNWNHCPTLCSNVQLRKNHVPPSCPGYHDTQHNVESNCRKPLLQYLTTDMQTHICSINYGNELRVLMGHHTCEPTYNTITVIKYPTSSHLNE
jgi:hypothetical protein